MSIQNLVLLLISTTCSVGRNMFNKRISGNPFPSKAFFCAQAILFLAADIFILLFAKLETPHKFTVIYAVIYAFCLIGAQWFYTMALQKGTTSVCAAVYSLNFIFPTLSGALFWKETLGLTKIIGILLVIPALYFSSLQNGPKEKKNPVIPLLLSMVCAGGLGIMQKVQQSSPYEIQTGSFMLISISLASIFSLIGFLFQKKDDTPLKIQPASFICGFCYGGANLLNTMLAGRLDSALAFPMINISVIVTTLIASLIIYKEKLKKKDVGILIFSVASILVLNL